MDNQLAQAGNVVGNQVRHCDGDQKTRFKRRSKKAQPFRSFSSEARGRAQLYRVDHPEFAMLSPNGMELLFVADDGGIHQIYTPLIIEIETPGAQPAEPKTEGNGA